MLPQLGQQIDFHTNLKTEPSVTTVKGNTLVFQACISQLARKTGKAFHKGATCPHAEVGWSLLRILRNTMAETLICASGHVTEITHHTF